MAQSWASQGCLPTQHGAYSRVPACIAQSHARPHAPTRPHARVKATPTGTELRLDLWRALLLAGGTKVEQTVGAGSDLVRVNVARLQRLTEAPPAGYPAGPSGDQAVAMTSGPLEFLESTRRQYGEVAGLLMGGERVVLVSGPAAAKQVMVDQADVFVKKGTAFFPGSSLAGNGLLVSDGDLWARQRRLSNPSFRRAAVDAYAVSMVNATTNMINNRWQSGDVRDVYVDFGALTLQITMEALFGYSLQAPLPSEPHPPTQHAPASNHAAQAPASLSTQPNSIASPANGNAVRQPVSRPTQNGTAQRTSTQTENTSSQPALGTSATPARPTTNGTHREVTGTPVPASQDRYNITQPRLLPISAFQSSAEAERIVVSIERAFEFFTRRAGASMMLPEWLPTWDNLEFSAAVVQLDKIIFKIIFERRQQLADSSSPPPAQDLLQTMLLAVDDDGSRMDDVALRDELMTMLIAGQETSAILLGWACALLAHNPDIQEAAAAEVRSLLGDSSNGRAPAASDVQSLPLVEAVVLEALRLHPPAYLVGRCCNRDVQLGEHTLPAGTTILVSPYLMHRDTSVWGADADQFRPSRWLEWQSQPSYKGFMTVLSGLGPNGSYLPFGGGPRNCIGTGFAMMEAILVLAAVLQRFQLQRPVPSGQTAPFPTAKPLLTMRPDAINLRLQAR